MAVLVRLNPNVLQLSPFMENLPENSTGSEESVDQSDEPVDKTVKPKPGLRLELRGQENYYKAILHIGSTLIPISDDILEDLRAKTALTPDEFFSVFVEKVGYSSYLQEQIRQEVKDAGDIIPQMSAIQQTLRLD